MIGQPIPTKSDIYKYDDMPTFTVSKISDVYRVSRVNGGYVVDKNKICHVRMILKLNINMSTVLGNYQVGISMPKPKSGYPISFLASCFTDGQVAGRYQTKTWCRAGVDTVVWSDVDAALCISPMTAIDGTSENIYFLICGDYEVN